MSTRSIKLDPKDTLVDQYREQEQTQKSRGMLQQAHRLRPIPQDARDSER
jgi:hypothetical protein